MEILYIILNGIALMVVAIALVERTSRLNEDVRNALDKSAEAVAKVDLIKDYLTSIRDHLRFETDAKLRDGMVRIGDEMREYVNRITVPKEKLDEHIVEVIRGQTTPQENRKSK